MDNKTKALMRKMRNSMKREREQRLIDKRSKQEKCYDESVSTGFVRAQRGSNIAVIAGAWA